MTGKPRKPAQPKKTQQFIKTMVQGIEPVSVEECIRATLRGDAYAGMELAKFIAITLREQRPLPVEVLDWLTAVFHRIAFRGDDPDIALGLRKSAGNLPKLDKLFEQDERAEAVRYLHRVRGESEELAQDAVAHVYEVSKGTVIEDCKAWALGEEEDAKDAAITRLSERMGVDLIRRKAELLKQVKQLKVGSTIKRVKKKASTEK